MTTANMFTWLAFGILAIVFMLAPMMLLVVFSFSEASVLSMPITGWTLDWYRRLFETDQFWVALENSLLIALTVGIVSTIVGTMAAFALLRVRTSLASATMLAASLPVMLPPLVLALSLLTFFIGAGLPLGRHAVILGHLVYTQPFVILIVYARLATFDRAIIESARDLGASSWTAFRTVVLPVIRPTVVGAGLVSMALSLDDFVITLFTIGGGNTLPTFLWGMLRKGVNPSINVVGIVLVALIVAASLLALRMTRYRG
jgi:spermidine/putrescine transport system permease protein